jgi:magnesium-transporting ATPase (P-type)
VSLQRQPGLASGTVGRLAVPHLPRGLSDADVGRLREQWGPNLLPAAEQRPWWRHLLDQLVHFFALLLWVAAGLALLAGLPELAVAIAVVVVVNGVFAFAEERGAERAAARLRDLLPRQVTVVREGHRCQVEAADLVPGDVVLLDAGDRVPADMRLSECLGLQVDTSLLTGESVPVRPDADEQIPGGAFVVEGEAVGSVVATGSHTRLAGIAELTEHTTRPRTPLEVELRRLVRTIAVVAVSVGLVFFVLGAVRGLDWQSTLVFGIGVTVALVPEALLPTLTLSLAIGAQRMARRNGLVRELDSVETLGSVTYICTDKTGTLTRNEMQVVRVWTPVGTVEVSGDGYAPTADISGPKRAVSAALDAAVAGLACSTGRAVHSENGWVAHGDPMEAALDTLVRRLGGAPTEPPLARFPFDPRRRMMSVVVDGSVLVKGAPDAVLTRCAKRPSVEDVVHGFAEVGLRTLAIARRDLDGATPASAAEAEQHLELLGIVGLLDPPRPQVHDSIQACRQAGIRVAVVTGDHPSTAAAVAEQVGLLDHGRLVLSGADLPDSTDQLGELLDRDGVVLARVSPEDKLRVAQALQKRGHVVAMTGDGVNDGPALREADVGVAMGRSGSDVARDAADLVLLDDDFATIVAAIEQGRATFRNIRRFLTYHLTDNVAELFPLVVWSLSAGQIPLALGVLQILALDLATDTLSAVALGSEPARPTVMQRGPVHGRLLDRLTAWRAFGLLGPLEALSGFAAFLVVLGIGGWRLGDPAPSAGLLAAASGAYFLSVVATQSVNAFACRSTRRPPWRLGWCTNRLLCIAVAVELAAALVMLLWQPLADVLGHANPGITGWALAAGAAGLLLLADAAWKLVRSTRHALPPEPDPSADP